MSEKLKIRLIDISGKIEEYEGDVLICKTPLGEISLLPNHQPIITVINKGNIFIKTNGLKKSIEILEDSLLNLNNNIATIVTLFHTAK